MCNKKIGSLGGIFAVASLAWGATTPANAAVIEFSEVPLVNATSLAGSNAFAAYGLHFTGSAAYSIDSRFIGAGTDDKGITTGPSAAIMGVSFDTPVSSVTFDGLSVNTDFFATAFDSGNNILQGFSTPIQAGTAYFSHTFSGIGNISRVEFHDNNNFIGVGRLDFTPIPEPATISAGALGLTILALRRRRR